MSEDLATEKAMTNINMTREDYWRCWKLQSDNSRQTWHFQLPESLKGVVKTDDDWDKPDAQAFLEGMMKAFHVDPTSNANSSDLVYRLQVTGEISEGKLFEGINSEKDHPDPSGHPSFPGVEPVSGISSPGKGRWPKAGGVDISHVETALRKGWKYFERLQQPTGNWPSDYGGPMFLIPGLVTISHITETPLPVPQQKLIIQYLYNQQNEDGGWGLHIEGHSTMFGTVMNYVTLRLLGEKADEERVANAGNWIREKGGATSIPPWGKFYLSILGLYDWSGNDSLFPELWILPKWLPMHPSKYWCHARMVYLPMSYAYGHKITTEETDLTRDLRSEIYPKEYAEIDWKAARGRCHKLDEYTPVDSLFTNFSKLTSIYEVSPLKSLRKRALKFASDYVDAEDEHTVFVDIGPVNQVINSLV
ncbi:MAG: hypothetical protein ACI9YU_000959, partial [Flavobacteriales bacterium]